MKYTHPILATLINAVAQHVTAAPSQPIHKEEPPYLGVQTHYPHHSQASRSSGGYHVQPYYPPSYSDTSQSLYQYQNAHAPPPPIHQQPNSYDMPYSSNPHQLGWAAIRDPRRSQEIHESVPYQDPNHINGNNPGAFESSWQLNDYRFHPSVPGTPPDADLPNLALTIGTASSGFSSILTNDPHKPAPHRKGMPHACQCGQVYDDNEELKDHFQTSRQDGKIYPCPKPECPMAYDFLTDINGHYTSTGHGLPMFRQ